MLWTDNMCIPKGAENKGQAELWINFYYEPENAADHRGLRQLRLPGQGRREAMLALDEELATNAADLPDRGDDGPTAPVPGQRPRTRRPAGPRTSRGSWVSAPAPSRLAA